MNFSHSKLSTLLNGENIVSVVEGDVVRIEKSPHNIEIIRLTSRDYYQTWQQKLMRS